MRAIFNNEVRFENYEYRLSIRVLIAHTHIHACYCTYITCKMHKSKFIFIIYLFYIFYLNYFCFFFNKYYNPHYCNVHLLQNLIR